MRNEFDWITDFQSSESDDCEDQELTGDPQYEEQKPGIRGARDFLRKRAEKKLDGDGVSPAYRQGYSAGWVDGRKEGEEIGFKKGMEYMRKHLELCDLPQ